MAAPNIVNVTTITGKTAVQAVGVSATAIVENTADSGKVFKINVLTIANVDGSSAADITVDLFRSSTAYHISKTITINANSTFMSIDKTTPVYLEEGDSIRLTASAAGDLEAICSYEEIS